MPFAPVPVSTEDLVSYLTDNCGTEVNTKQLFEASEHFNCSLATVKKRLKDYKRGIGKWDLTVQERLEKILVNYKLNHQIRLGDKIFRINSVSTDLVTGKAEFELYNIFEDDIV